MTRHILIIGLVAAAITMGSVNYGHAQIPGFWIGAVSDNYNEAGNWEVDDGSGGVTNEVPNAAFDDDATIDNGDTVMVTDTPTEPAGLNVSNGTLVINGTGNLTVSAGVSAPGRIVTGANGAIHVASGGTLSAAQNLTNNGILQVTGPTANVSAMNNLVFGAGGTLITQINSGAFNPLSADGNATLGGTLNVDFGAFTPALADSWTIITATSGVTGNFDTVSIAKGISGQPQAVPVVDVGATDVTLGFEERLVLTVNRPTGAAAIDNLGGSPIELDGYTLISGLNSLTPGGLNSFQDQGFDSNGWNEIGVPTASGIGELNPFGVGTINPGESRSLGNIYADNTTMLGVDAEDIVFEYVAPDGSQQQGVVQYLGDKVFNNLVLFVDTTTGGAVVQHQSSVPIAFDGYRIRSEGGSLLTSYSSLQDQGIDGGNWFEIGSQQSANDLVELLMIGEKTMTQGDMFDFGTLFNTSGPRDLAFEFVLAGETVGNLAQVCYDNLDGCALLMTPDGVAGDYNGDGVVGPEDYTIFANNRGGDSSVFAAGSRDPSLSGPIVQADWDFWKAKFIEANTAMGSGGQVVPEPVSLLLVSALAAILAFSRRRLTD